MRQKFTGELMTAMNTFAIARCLCFSALLIFSHLIGLGTRLLPHPNRPHRPHRLHQHRHHLPRRLPLRLRRQRRHNPARGSQHLYSLTAGDEIHALVFSPNRYWLCAATSSSIIIFDLEKKSKVDELKPEYTAVGKKSREPECVSLAWSADGQTLFAGYTDNLIRAWGVMSRQ